MATMKDKYFKNMLENIVNHNDLNNALMSNEKLRQAVSKFMVETEGEESKARYNSKNVTLNTFY